PAFFLFLPPHCLKKNATPARWHWSRISVTQAGSIGRERGPDSPPTITQNRSMRTPILVTDLADLLVRLALLDANVGGQVGDLRLEGVELRAAVGVALDEDVPVERG